MIVLALTVAFVLGVAFAVAAGFFVAHWAMNKALDG